MFNNDMFTNKVLMITGGTGSFGGAVLKRFLDTDIKEIRRSEEHTSELQSLA